MSAPKNSVFYELKAEHHRKLADIHADKMEAAQIRGNQRSFEVHSRAFDQHKDEAERYWQKSDALLKATKHLKEQVRS